MTGEDIPAKLRAMADRYKPPLISWDARDDVLRCRDHGIVAENPPAPARTVLLLEHLRDVHGMNAETALAAARNRADRSLAAG